MGIIIMCRVANFSFQIFLYFVFTLKKFFFFLPSADLTNTFSLLFIS